MFTKGSRVILPLAVVIFAFLLRVAGIGQVSSYTGDQVTVIPGMYNFLSSGNYAPDAWEHPPLKYYLLRASMFLFGNNAYGWRMKNALFGTVTVLLLFLLCRELFPDARVAVLAMVLLAIDPLHIFFSRTIHGETSSIPFLLIAVYSTIRYTRNKIASPLFAGLSLGLALSQKWYFVLSLLMLMAYVVVIKVRESRFRPIDALHAFATYCILPFCVYMVPFYPWFKRGYGFIEFVEMQISAYRVLQDQALETFANRAFLSSVDSPWEWFIKPIISGVKIPGGPEGWGRFFVFMNDPPVWLLTLPALAFFIYRIRKTRTPEWSLITLLFCISYLQFAVVNRPIFLYSAIVVLPFAFIMVAYLLIALADAVGPVWPYRAMMAALLVWGAYLYPFAMNMLVPLSLYAPLLAMGSVHLTN